MAESLVKALAMIITCPECATGYDVPIEPEGLHGRQVICEACGTGWRVDAYAAPPPPVAPDLGAATPRDELEEAPPHETAEAPPPAQANLPLEAIDVKSEAARLARVSLSANQAFERNQQERARTLRGWAMLAGAVALISAPAVAVPAQVTSLFPAAAKLYAKAGVKVNRRGLEFRKLTYKRVIDEKGVLMLQIEGSVENITTSERTVPPVRVALLDKARQEIYGWTLNVEQERLAPAASIKFETRLASPPDDAVNLRIRFANPDEAATEN